MALVAGILNVIEFVTSILFLFKFFMIPILFLKFTFFILLV